MREMSTTRYWVYLTEMKPTTLDTVYFGGMLLHMWTWPGVHIRRNMQYAGVANDSS